MSAELPPIRGFIENTLIDWEGKIACEVFLPTCNLRCPFCHAGHLLTNDGELESIPASAVTACLDRHRGWVDGVVISGGEPTLHPTLDALIEEFRAHGAMIKLDTNGTRPDVLADLLGRGLIEAVSMDIKAPFDGRYEAAAGGPCDVAAIRQSTEIIMGSEADYEFRTTVCPPFHTFEDLREIAQAIHGAKMFVLQQFVPGDCLDPAMNKVEAYPVETLRGFATELDHYVDVCIVRGDWAGD
jgi:pyruvate formate lyase activating enzyme